MLKIYIVGWDMIYLIPTYSHELGWGFSTGPGDVATYIFENIWEFFCLIRKKVWYQALSSLYCTCPVARTAAQRVKLTDFAV